METQTLDAAAPWPMCRLCDKPFKPGTGRGPGSTACSRNKCRSKLYGATDKDARIRALEAQVAEKDAVIASQAAVINLLQSSLQCMQLQVAPPLRAPAAAAKEQPAKRQPLASRNANAGTMQPAKRTKESAASDEDSAADESDEDDERTPRDVVYDWFRCRPLHGATASEAAHWLDGHGLSMAQIQVLIAEMVQDGTMFSTIDADHFHVTTAPQCMPLAR